MKKILLLLALSIITGVVFSQSATIIKRDGTKIYLVNVYKFMGSQNGTFYLYDPADKSCISTIQPNIKKVTSLESMKAHMERDNCGNSVWKVKMTMKSGSIFFKYIRGNFAWVNGLDADDIKYSIYLSDIKKIVFD